MLKPNEARTYVFHGADSVSSEGAPPSNDGFGSGHGKPADEEQGDSARKAREMFLASERPDLARRRRDYRTGTITTAVIALSVLLGWMVGRAGWNMAVTRAQGQSPEVPEEVLAAIPGTSYPLVVSPRAQELTDLAKPTRVAPVSPAAKPSPKSKSAAVQPDGALVMYERGKVVFRAAAPPKATSPSANQGGMVHAEATGESDTPTASDPNLHSATNGYLLSRVVPKYPEDAWQQRTEGPVVLNILVGTDGSVRDLKVISGNHQLVQAAVDAVRQWRFQPHRLKGEPAEFETQITVNFSLR